MVDAKKVFVTFTTEMPIEHYKAIQSGKSFLEACMKNNEGKHFTQKFYPILGKKVLSKFNLKYLLFGAVLTVGAGCIVYCLYKKRKSNNNLINKEVVKNDIDNLEDCIYKLNNDSDKFISLESIINILSILNKYSKSTNNDIYLKLDDRLYAILINYLNSIISQIKEIDFDIIDYKELSNFNEKNLYVANALSSLKEFMEKKDNLDKIYIKSNQLEIINE